MSDANPLDGLLDKAADELLRRVEDFPEAAQPVGGIRLTPDQQLEGYTRIRDDPQALLKVIQEQGEREAVRYVRAMEKLLEGRQAERSRHEEKLDATTAELLEESPGGQHPGPVQAAGIGSSRGSVAQGSAPERDKTPTG